MTISLFILLILIIGFQFNSLKIIYLFDKPKYKIAKTLNVTIILFLLWWISGQSGNIKMLLFDFDEFKTKYFISVFIIDKWIVFINKIVLISLTLYLLLVVQGLIKRKLKSRKIFLKIIPYLTLSEIIEFARLLKHEIVDFKSFIVIGSIIAFVLMIIFVPLYIVYNTKTFKKMMNLDNLKIKEIVLNKKMAAPNNA